MVAAGESAKVTFPAAAAKITVLSPLRRWLSGTRVTLISWRATISVLTSAQAGVPNEMKKAKTAGTRNLFRGGPPGFTFGPLT